MQNSQLNFDEKGLIPVIAQDYLSNEILMIAYMNKEAYDKTISTGKMYYYSRSRQKLWLKGETSGHYQYLKSLRVDCDSDALLAKVEQIDNACHTGNYTCFYREIDKDGSVKELTKYKINNYDNRDGHILQELYQKIKERKHNPKKNSYTNYLFDNGIDKILKKVGEETAEVIIAAKNNSHEELTYEVSDLIYHLFVLLVENKVRLEDIYDELESRR